MEQVPEEVFAAAALHLPHSRPRVLPTQELRCPSVEFESSPQAAPTPASMAPLHMPSVEEDDKLLMEE
jgi:hypothetical protein